MISLTINLQGTHDELVAQKGVYENLVQKQLKGDSKKPKRQRSISKERKVVTFRKTIYKRTFSLPGSYHGNFHRQPSVEDYTITAERNIKEDI